MEDIKPASFEKIPLFGGFFCSINETRATDKVAISTVLRIYTRWASC